MILSGNCIDSSPLSFSSFFRSLDIFTNSCHSGSDVVYSSPCCKRDQPSGMNSAPSFSTSFSVILPLSKGAWRGVIPSGLVTGGGSASSMSSSNRISTKVLQRWNAVPYRRHFDINDLRDDTCQSDQRVLGFVIRWGHLPYPRPPKPHSSYILWF